MESALSKNKNPTPLTYLNLMRSTVMLTTEELFALPIHYFTDVLINYGCYRDYFEDVIAPTLSKTTFDTDNGYVLTNEGKQVDIFAAVVDGIVDALSSDHLKVDALWRASLLKHIAGCFRKQYIFSWGVLGSKGKTYVQPHVVEKHIETLEKWIDKFAENRGNDILTYIITPLMRISGTLQFNPTVMHLVDRMHALGIKCDLLSWHWNKSIPDPLQQNLLFMLRTQGPENFMYMFTECKSRLTDGGILAKAFLESLVHHNNLQSVHPPVCVTMTRLLDLSTTSVSHVELEDLTRKALTFWLDVFENNSYHQMKEPGRFLRQLVRTYRMQAWRAYKFTMHKARLRAAYYVTRKLPPNVFLEVRDCLLREHLCVLQHEQDEALIHRARVWILSFDQNSSWPEDTMPRLQTHYELS